MGNGRINTKITSNPTNYGLYPSNIRQEPATYAVTPPNARDRVRLANTKSLGDFYAHQYGLSHVPDVQMESLPSSSTYYLVVASDGVWDTWIYSDVVTRVLNWKNTKQSLAENMQIFLKDTKSMG